ncbi:MAG: hypothetical protein ACXAD7_09975 [Candidatus Kariarchaeaceae archaeon]|jgi:hypothetical protein
MIKFEYVFPSGSGSSVGNYEKKLFNKDPDFIDNTISFLAIYDIDR